MKEIKEINSLCSWIERLKTLNSPILIYRYNAIPTKILAKIFVDTDFSNVYEKTKEANYLKTCEKEEEMEKSICLISRLIIELQSPRQFSLVRSTYYHLKKKKSIVIWNSGTEFEVVQLDVQWNK